MPVLPWLRVVGGQYVLGEPLGQGSTAVVYRAWDRTLHRVVAVKVFRTRYDPAEDRRAALEVATLAGLDHPGLIRLLDSGCDFGDRFMVLELVDGESLGQRLAEGALPRVAATALAAQVARTLAYVHGRGVVHRDVKPANVLVDQAGRARLGDFGVARSVGFPQALTETGCIIGTPRYMAPEQVRGEPVTGAVDVYALGLVLLECLTGAPEYSGTGLACAVARLYRPPVVPEWVPRGLAALIVAMTDGDPGRRPPAADAAERLQPGRHLPPPVVLPAPVPVAVASVPVVVPVVPVVGSAAGAEPSAGQVGAAGGRWLRGPRRGSQSLYRALMAAAGFVVVLAFPLISAWDVVRAGCPLRRGRGRALSGVGCASADGSASARTRAASRRTSCWSRAAVR